MENPDNPDTRVREQRGGSFFFLLLWAFTSGLSGSAMRFQKPAYDRQAPARLARLLEIHARHENRANCRIRYRVVQEQGVAAANVGRMYKPVAERSMSVLGSDTTIEVKRRANGFARLYDRLNDRDVLIGRAGRQEPLVVVRMSLAAEIAKATTGTCTECDKGRAA
jgi:hypothetical protein